MATKKPASSQKTTRAKKPRVYASYSSTNRTRQTGKSNERSDTLRKAKPPGWRVSKSGKEYFEARLNRSDSKSQLQAYYDTRDARTEKKKLTLTGLIRVIKKFETSIRKKPTEFVYAIDTKGKVAFKNGDGKTNSCSVEGMPIGCAIMTHNHPRSSSFSSDDIAVAISREVDTIRVCSELYDYQVRPKNGVWVYKYTAEKGSDLRIRQRNIAAADGFEAHNEIMAELQDKKYNDMYNNLLEKAVLKHMAKYGKLTREDESALSRECSRITNIHHSHEGMQKLSKKYGWVYTRKEHKE